MGCSGIGGLQGWRSRSDRVKVTGRRPTVWPAPVRVKALFSGRIHIRSITETRWRRLTRPGQRPAGRKGTEPSAVIRAWLV